MRVRPGGPAYRHLPVRARKIGASGVVKFLLDLTNQYGARRLGRCFPYNSKQVAILPAIRAQSRYPGMVVVDVSRPYAQLQGSLRSNAKTECRLAIGVVSIELLRARAIVLVGKTLRTPLESHKGPSLRNAIRVASQKLLRACSDPDLVERWQSQDRSPASIRCRDFRVRLRRTPQGPVRCVHPAAGMRPLPTHDRCSRRHWTRRTRHSRRRTRIPGGCEQVRTASAGWASASRSAKTAHLSRSRKCCCHQGLRCRAMTRA